MNRAFVWSIDQHTNALHSLHWMRHTHTHTHTYHSNHHDYYYCYHQRYKCPSFQFWIESEISSNAFWISWMKYPRMERKKMEKEWNRSGFIWLSFPSQLHQNGFDWIKIYHYFSLHAHSEWAKEQTNPVSFESKCFGFRQQQQQQQPFSSLFQFTEHFFSHSPNVHYTFLALFVAFNCCRFSSEWPFFHHYHYHPLASNFSHSLFAHFLFMNPFFPHSTNKQTTRRIRNEQKKRAQFINERNQSRRFDH